MKRNVKNGGDESLEVIMVQEPGGLTTFLSNTPRTPLKHYLTTPPSQMIFPPSSGKVILQRLPAIL